MSTKMTNNVDQLQEALEIALETLKFFKENETFVYENSKDWPLSVSDKAEDAIDEINELVVE